MRRVLFGLAFAAGVALASPAAAQGNAEANKAFDEGRKLLDAKDFAGALGAFVRASKLEPSVGAFYNIGACHEQLGQLREAREAYVEAREIATRKQDARLGDVREALDKLLATHAWVKVDVDGAVARADGLDIKVDRSPLSPALFNAEVFTTTDKPEHEIVIRAAGRKPVTLVVRDRGTAIAVLGEPENAASNVAAPVREVPAGKPPGAEAEASTDGWGWKHWTGISAIVVGAAGITYGVVRLVSYSSDEGDLDAARRDACGITSSAASGQCTSAQLPAFDAANAAYTRNEDDMKGDAPLVGILGGVGLGLIGGGIYLLATARSGSAERGREARAAGSPSKREPIRLLPQLGRRTGFVLSGSF